MEVYTVAHGLGSLFGVFRTDIGNGDHLRLRQESIDGAVEFANAPQRRWRL